MIDAYEIGIQILLQEDVSAGLAAINRGLAEVDQAIAATSAELVGLVQEAQKASTAASAAVGHRATSAAAADHDPPEAIGAQAAQRPPENAVVTGRTAASGEKAAAPEIKAAEKPAPVTPAALYSPEEARPVGQPNVPEHAFSSSAPIAGGVAGDTARDQRTGQLEGATFTQPSIGPAPLAPAAPQPREIAPPAATDGATAAPAARRTVTPPAAQVALTASISRLQQPGGATRPSEQVRHKAMTGTAVERERPAAPWSGVNQFAAQADTTRVSKRAAAPNSAEQVRSESGGGTVMLDGRLVGQWLSEHMAREASRPPAGTSFFDPRQTPAWNVSGAL